MIMLWVPLCVSAQELNTLMTSLAKEITLQAANDPMVDNASWDGENLIITLKRSLPEGITPEMARSDDFKQLIVQTALGEDSGDFLELVKMLNQAGAGIMLRFIVEGNNVDLLITPSDFE